MKISTFIAITCMAITGSPYITAAALDDSLKTQAQADADQFERERATKESRSLAESDDTDDTPLAKIALTKCQTPKARLSFHKSSAQAIAEQAGLDRDKLMRLPLDIHHTIWSFKTTNRKKAIAQNMGRLLLAVLNVPRNLSLDDILQNIDAMENQVKLHNQTRPHPDELHVSALSQITRYSGRLSGEGNVGPHYQFKHAGFEPTYASLKVLKMKKARFSVPSVAPGPTDEPLLTVLYLTNGSHLFKIDEFALYELLNLTDDQFNFLLSLHELREYNIRERRTDEISLSDDELKMFYSLPFGIFISCTKNYNIPEVAGRPSKKQATILAAHAIKKGLAFISKTVVNIIPLYWSELSELNSSIARLHKTY